MHRRVSGSDEEFCTRSGHGWLCPKTRGLIYMYIAKTGGVLHVTCSAPPGLHTLNPSIPLHTRQRLGCQKRPALGGHGLMMEGGTHGTSILLCSGGDFEAISGCGAPLSAPHQKLRGACAILR